MSDDEMRIAVAELVGRNGWWCPDCKKLVSEYSLGYQCRHANCTSSARQAPDYANDLNSIHEAESKLTANEQLTYAQHLHSLFKGQRHYLHKDFDVLHTTARQRCEAFLRTKGKWTEEQNRKSPS